MTYKKTSSIDIYPSPPPLLDVVRPNFFAGQTLSDEDLSLLMSWTEQRLRLAALCDDWGIACGLHVAIDPDNRTRVLIGPGYAFNSQRQPCVVSGPKCGCSDDQSCQCQNKKWLTYCLPLSSNSGCRSGEKQVYVGPRRLPIFSICGCHRRNVRNTTLWGFLPADVATAIPIGSRPRQR